MSTCQLAKCPWCLSMYVRVCQSFFGVIESSPALPSSIGDMACSLPGNLGHPQSYTALYKSLKYSTCTVVVTVQKYTSTLCFCLSLRTSFPARSRVWELCVLFLPGDCSGAQQSGQGKTAHLPLIMHHIFRTQIQYAGLYPKKGLHLPRCMPQMAPSGNGAHSGDDSTSH